MTNTKEQINKIERQLAGSLVPESIKPALRKKLEQLKGQSIITADEQNIINRAVEHITDSSSIKEYIIENKDDENYINLSAKPDIALALKKHIKTIRRDIIPKVSDWEELSQMIVDKIISNGAKDIKRQESKDRAGREFDAIKSLGEKEKSNDGYQQEVIRQKEQVLIDDDTEGVSIMGMMTGKDSPVSKLREEKNKKPDINGEYENQYYLNKAIEQLIDWNIDNNNSKFSVEEMKFLEKYSGYGGLQAITKKLSVREKGIMTEYYTPDPLIQTMWGLAYKHGFEDGGTILENSVGIGKFLKYAPENSDIEAFEINKYSYYICKILYPDVDIRNIAYEENFVNDTKMSVKGNVEEEFDLIIGNPPYGKFESTHSSTEKKYTKANNLTEYFITRSLDQLKSGGLLVYVIGASIENGGIPFLDSVKNECKIGIEKKADLVCAYRLGNRIFEGTGVLADIIVFKKK